jgi:hypothetical protein
MRKRHLSEFLLRELLFDYVEGTLDAERKLAVEEALQEYPEQQAEVQGLRNAKSYARKLSGLRCDIEFAQSLEPKVQTLKSKLSHAKGRFPVPLGWTVQAILLALVIGAVVALGPRFIGNRPTTTDLVLSEEPLGPKSTPVPESMVVAAGPTVQPTILQDQIPDLPDGTEGTVPVPTIVVANKQVQPAPAASAVDPSERGFVYRMSMSTSKVDAITPEVRAKIEALGGKKAGEVELGWKRRSGSYFHFAMPEADYDTLVEYLRAQSPVRIQKAPHRRIMPAGQIRIILWLEYNTAMKRSDGEHGEQEGESIQ